MQCFHRVSKNFQIFIGFVLIFISFDTVCASIQNINTNSPVPSLLDSPSLSNLIEPMISLGHTDSIFAADFSTDGRLAFSLAKDQTLRVWEVATGREIKRYRMQSDQVKALAVSPNGYWVVSGGEGETIKLWDVATGKKIQVFSGHKRQVNALEFSPDGKYLVSAGNDRLIKLWDIKTSNLRHKFRGHKQAIKTLAYSNNGKWIASAGEDKQVFIWDVSRNKRIKVLKAHRNTILSIKFSPDDKYLVSASEDKEIILWDWEKTIPIKYFKGHSKAVNSIDFSNDGRHLISASDDQSLRLWDILLGKEILDFKGHIEKVIVARFSPNNQFILSGSTDNTLRLWGAKSANQIYSFKGLATLANDVKFSSDGRYVFSAHDDRTMKLWDMKTGQNIRVFSRHNARVNSIAFSDDNKLAVSGSSDNAIKLWSLEEGIYLRQLIGHKASVNQVIFNSDSTQVLSASADKTIKLWDIKDSHLIKSFVGHTRSVTAIAYSADDNTFLSAAKDNTFRHWDISTGDSKLISKTSSPINAIEYTDDGKFAITAGWDIILWSMQTGQMLHKFLGHSSEINDIAISKDGQKLVTASWDNSVKLWDIQSGDLIHDFIAHYGGVNSVAFSPDNHRIISAGADGSLKLWDIESGQEIIRMIGANDGEWITLTSDGYYDRSPEGNKLIHWVTKESTQSYSFEQFEQQFNKPEIIRARLTNQKNSGTPTPKMSAPPRIELVEHLQNFIREDDFITLNIGLIDNTLINNIRFFVNGRLVLSETNQLNKQSLSFSVPLFSGANQIEVRAYNHYGQVSDPRYVSVFSSKTNSKKPDLHILSIGVSKYEKLPEDAQLSFAHSDAENFIKRFNTSSADMYENINNIYLPNKKAYQNAIIESLLNLSKVDKDDLIMIFFAGHGVKDPNENQYYLVTHDTDINNLAETAINWDLLNQHFKQIKSRIVMFLDACHSGSISNQTIVPNNELVENIFGKDRSGVMVFSATKGRQNAAEGESIGIGEGLFSFAISKVLDQEGQNADSNGNGFIEFSELVKYVQVFVDEFSDGQQTPWLSHKEMFGDIPIAKVKPK